MRKVVLDCDTGTDDAVAIMLAALHPDIELLAVMTVWGNADVATTTDNTLRVLDHIECSDIPVFTGLNRPLVPRPAGVAERKALQHDHRSPGLPFPARVSRAHDEPAVEWLVEMLRATTEPVTLVSTGPLTNLAAALTIDPQVAETVEEVVVLGGAHAVGNVTPSADRNFWNDPASVSVVLTAGFQRLVLVTLDATIGAPLTAEQGQVLRALGTAAGTAAADLLDVRIHDYAALPSMRLLGAAPLHDPLAIACLLDPGMVTLRHVHVAVETSGGFTFGRSVIDLDAVGGETPNAHVALEADASGYFELLRSTFDGRC